MNIFQVLYNEVISFLGIGDLIEMAKTGDYSKLLTLSGVLSAISPFIPLLLIIEIIRAVFYKRFKIDDYKVPFLIFIANRVISGFISIAAVAFCIGLLEPVGPFKTTFTWYWLIYG